MDPFNVPCGDWIYPARDSSTGVQYPIDKPLVVEIFKDNSGDKVSDAWQIDHHLVGPRYVKVSLPKKETLMIDALGNQIEPMFSHSIGFAIKFKQQTLARPNDLWLGGVCSEDFARPSRMQRSDWNGIFFTSVLLQAYLAGRPLPEGVTFREATMPEIESLGRWRH